MLIIVKNLYLTKISVHMVRYGCIKDYNENLEYYGKLFLKISYTYKDRKYIASIRVKINQTIPHLLGRIDLTDHKGQIQPWKVY